MAQTTTLADLQALLQHHDSIATALRTTVELLSANGNGATNGIGGGVPVTRKYKKRRKAARLTAKQIRQRSAGFLAQFSPNVPQTFPGKLGPFIRSGYLKKKGDGYIRTAKVFTP